MYNDASICIAKAWATSRSLGTLTYCPFSFTVFYVCSTTFLSIYAVPRSAIFWTNSTFIAIHNVLRFYFRSLGIVLKVPLTMCITVASIFQSLFICLARCWFLSTFSCSFLYTLLCLQALQWLLGVPCCSLCLQLQCLVIGVQLHDQFGYLRPMKFWHFSCLSPPQRSIHSSHDLRMSRADWRQKLRVV